MQVQLTKPNIFQKNMTIVVRTQTEVFRTREGETVLKEAQIKQDDFSQLGSCPATANIGVCF